MIAMIVSAFIFFIYLLRLGLLFVVTEGGGVKCRSLLSRRSLANINKYEYTLHTTHACRCAQFDVIAHCACA